MIRLRIGAKTKERKVKSASLAVFVLGAMWAMWGGVATPTASAAAICADSVQSVGNFKNRVGGACIEESIFRTKLYIVVESTEITKISAGVGCAKVTEAKSGNYKNSTCTEEVEAGTGSFVKVVIEEGGGEAGSKWTVSGTDAGTLKAGVQLTSLVGGSATLLTKIGGASVSFLTSTTPTLNGVSLEGSGTLTTGGTVTFKGVTTDLNGKASAVCTPLGTAGNDGTLGVITSSKGKGGLVLHTGGVGVTQIKPETGNVFGKFFFGEECSLPEEVPIITKASSGRGLVLSDPLGIGNELVTHQITQHSLTELWAISETEEHKATIDGTANIALTGAHTGLKWKGTPG